MNFTVVSLIVAGLVTLGVTVNNVAHKTNEEHKTVTTSSVPSINNEVSANKQVLQKLNIVNDRTVYIYGEINGSHGPEIATKILSLGDSKEPMYVFINSPGGSVLVGATIISAIEAAKGPVNTICVQLCASMAAMIHQYGTQRLVMGHSILMFHPASGGGPDGEVDKQFSELNFFKRFIGKMEANAASRAKITYKEYKYLSGTELWLDSEDAVSSNFADKTVYLTGEDVVKLSPSIDPRQGEVTVKLPVTTVKSHDIVWE